MDRYVNVPLSEKDAHSLKAGDYVYLQAQYIRQEMQRTRECRRLWTEEKNFR